MKAKIGDVYTIYNNRLRLHTACQITNVIEGRSRLDQYQGLCHRKHLPILRSPFQQELLQSVLPLLPPRLLRLPHL